MHTGACWWEIPARFAPWHTVYDHSIRWQRAGVWARILLVLRSPTASSG
ncbi:MAG: transposase [Thermomicrobiales bacterium]